MYAISEKFFVRLLARIVKVKKIFSVSFVSIELSACQITNGKCSANSKIRPTEYQLVLDLHQELSAALLKGYVSVQLSYMILTVEKGGLTYQLCYVWLGE